MRIALFAPGYPSAARPYAHGFVHTRAQLYAARGHQVFAFSLGARSSYEHDQVPVVTGEPEDCVRAIAQCRAEVIAIHQPSFRMIRACERLPAPRVAWLHGSEVMWSLHTVDFERTIPKKLLKLGKAGPRNVMQMLALRRFLPQLSAAVFVSGWLRAKAEKHLSLELSNAVVIPNPIDLELFSYRFDPSRRTEAVTTRSLSSRVYGLDVAVRAFADAPARLTMIGTGALEKPLRRLAKRLRSSVLIDARQVPHRDMPALFARYGFFVAPSRREAQGVAMCEAMACGLPVIASRVGGIPEYVTHMQEGLLVPPNDPQTLRGAVRDLLSDDERYRAMSLAARARMERQCAPDRVIAQELALLEEAANTRQAPASVPIDP